jgi:hypothetical protein
MKKLILTLVIITPFLSACEQDQAGGVSTAGKGGSMARFAVSGNHLYTINTEELTTFDISDAQHPIEVDREYIQNEIETIFPFKDHLFLGSRSGMSIYSLAEPSNPQFVSNYQHIISCDPVVASGNYAYITLRNGSSCGTGASRLEVVDINNLANPSLVKTYSMEEPYGVGVDGNLLFVCDNGLKVYDNAFPTNLLLIKKFDISAYDVIPYNGNLIVIGSDGLYQYKYENYQIRLLSKMTMPRS